MFLIFLESDWLIFLLICLVSTSFFPSPELACFCGTGVLSLGVEKWPVESRFHMCSQKCGFSTGQTDSIAKYGSSFNYYQIIIAILIRSFYVEYDNNNTDVIQVVWEILL